MTEAVDEALPKVVGFWSWLVRRDREGDRGIYNLTDRWNIVGLALSGVLAWIAHMPAQQLALNVALPGAAALVGLSFAWAGRSSSLLQDKDFSEFIIEYGPPVEGYVYSFQLAVLSVAVFIVVSLSLISGGTQLTTGSPEINGILNRFLLLGVGFLAARECWGVIYFANKLSIQFLQIRSRKLEASQ